jgi:hypothetical protein
VLMRRQMLLAGVGCHTHQAAPQCPSQSSRVYCWRWCAASAAAGRWAVEGLPWRKAGHLLQQVGELNFIHQAALIAAAGGQGAAPGSALCRTGCRSQRCRHRCRQCTHLKITGGRCCSLLIVS